MQKWYCEQEACGKDISEDGSHFQCEGCGRWFCADHMTIFTHSLRGACVGCLQIWFCLCRVRSISHTLNFECF
jgi:hypothetical protein